MQNIQHRVYKIYGEKNEWLNFKLRKILNTTKNVNIVTPNFAIMFNIYEKSINNFNSVKLGIKEAYKPTPSHLGEGISG